MRRFSPKWFAAAGIILVLFVPVIASAHEVYVLTPQEIQAAVHAPAVSPFLVIEENSALFSLWAMFVLAVIAAVFFVSKLKWLERHINPIFARTKYWGPIISRITVGLSFLAAAYYQASYGPELPLAATYGPWTLFITIVLIVVGVLILVDVGTRYAAAIALIMYGIAIYHHGWYMLTYVNYFGEILILLLIGTAADAAIGRAGIAAEKAGSHERRSIADRFAPYGFAVMRVCFGVALIYTSVYAKLLYSNLALDTVYKYNLTKYLHFEPHFLVLGAAMIEILIGLFFVLGIEIRFTSLFFLFWLTLSLLFFGEVVWPHIILIGIPIAFFFYGYDRYSIEGYFLKHGDREPIL
jgi:hypothetical protein